MSEYSRWMGAFASFRPNHLPKSVGAARARTFSLSESARKVRAALSTGVRLWRVDGETDRPRNMLCQKKVWRTLSLSASENDARTFFFPPDLLTCSLTLQSWGAFH